MLVEKQISSSRKTILLLASLVVFGIAGYLGYQTFFAPETSIQTYEGSYDDLNKALQVQPTIKMDFLRKTPYTVLQPSANLPVTVSGAGRVNPFRPVQFIEPVAEESQQ
jgi:hypothetical protein